MASKHWTTGALLAALLAGCNAHHDYRADGDGPRLAHAKPRPSLPCKANAQGECEIDILPTGDWVPDYIDSERTPAGKYPRIRWKLDPRGPFKFGDHGIRFTDTGAPFGNCRAHGPYQFTCDNNATAPGGPWAYVVNLQFDPFVFNR